MKGDGYQSLGRLLSQVTDRPEFKAGLRRQEVLDRWEDIVGPQIARHSQAIALSDGVLTVRVEGSVWAQELSMLKPQIQRSIDDALGESSQVREIRFRSGRV